MKRFKPLAAGVAWLVLALPAGGAELTLRETLQRVLEKHPAVEAEKYRDEAGRQAVRQARSGYYPQVNADGIWSTGFPGSTGALGIGGLVGSPYRKGPAAGLMLQQNLFDFGRTSGEVTVAEKRRARDLADDRVERTQLAIGAVSAYYACAKDRSLADFYRGLVADARQVEKEIARFIRSGQRSVVDRYLSEAQSEEAVTAAADYEKRWQLDRQRLGILIGAQVGEAPDCLDLPATTRERVPSADPTHPELSPFVLRAQAEIGVAESEVSRARAGYYPRVVGLASVGYLDETQLGVPVQNYSLGVGVVIPLFEGFKTSAEVSRYQAETLQRQKEVEVAQRQLQETNVNYDKEIESARVRNEHLAHEVELARSAFKLAKRRYFSQAGTLVDLRETVNNLLRTQAQQKEAQAELLTRAAEKSLIDGSFALAEP